MTSINVNEIPMSNEQKITHLEELNTELAENDDKVYALTQVSRKLIDEIETLKEEIIWD